MLKYKRDILVIFAILDAFLLGRCALNVVSPPFHPEAPWWWQAMMRVQVVFLVSLAFSAFGLATARRWGFILSYVQFPFHILFMNTSFGFILMYALAAVTPGPLDSRIPGITSIVLECARLVVTILIHRRIILERAASARDVVESDA